MKLHIILFFIVTTFVYLYFVESYKSSHKQTSIGGATIDNIDIDVEKGTIFVSIPSYRDELCSATIESAFENAKYPGRVVIGACEQNLEISENCLNGPIKQGTIRLISIPHKKARGPCTARYYCYTLYQDEDLYLQVDSHTHFCKDWDVKSVEMINEMPNERSKSVISTYPIDAAIKDWETHEPPVITDAKWDGNFLTFSGSYQGHGYHTSRQIGGGFFLCVRSIVREVPLDPNLEGLFNNEEILYSARLFTHGIDIISPPENIVAHVYSYTSHKTPWEEDTFSWDQDTNGKERANKLLLGEINDECGMGNMEKLEDIRKYVNVDFENKVVGEWKTQKL